MDLKIKDVAELLDVSQTTIRRWLREGRIPAYRLNHQYRFSRSEIQSWIFDRRVSKEGEEESRSSSQVDLGGEEQEEESGKKGMQQFGLFRALHRGGVVIDVMADDKEQLIRDTMQQISSDLGIDPSVLSDLFLDRERLMPTALNHGIAVPHTRDFLLKGPRDVVVVVFPKEPIEWGALDKERVHTLFFLFACDDKRHLNLLAKIAHFSNSEERRAYFQTKPSKRELLRYVKEWEERSSRSSSF